ncbi:MAG TPA: cytochrome c peroxidase [Cyclobacteriaceae bacterium]|nr:cytochrome c peroxidase [Cyclobacteriaceae bacterium]
MKNLFGWLVVLSLVACADEDESPAVQFWQPDDFPPATYTFQNNPVTAPGFELGRMLFYDPVFSRDSTVSCANCHLQAVAFADPAHKISVGINDRIGTRNAPPIFNLAFKSNFFWDGGVNHIDFIPINAIVNPNELDQDIDVLISKLNKYNRYPQKFKEAFNKANIDSQQMLFALSQFMVMMVSANGRYDQYVNGNKSVLTEQEIRGLALVESKCTSCHTPPLFTNDGFANNGLDTEFTDRGRAIITESENDVGKFRVPTLRNVELTDPYMHDGRFRTLEQVLTHYQQGVKDSPTLDPLLKQNETPGIILSDTEKADIIAFLKTLTDRSFTQDKRFANPFLP